MSRLRIALTLVLVALAAMCIGLAATWLAARHATTRPGSPPEATEPDRRPTSPLPAAYA